MKVIQDFSIILIATLSLKLSVCRKDFAFKHNSSGLHFLVLFYFEDSFCPSAMRVM